MMVDPETLGRTTLVCIPLFALQLPVVKFVAPPWSDLSVLPLGPLDGLVTWKVIRKHMAISVQNCKEGRWWTLMTHILAHTSTEHYVSNCIGTFFNAIGIINEYGERAFFGSYIMGAVFGGLATLAEYQWNLKDFLKGLKRTFIGTEVISSIGRKTFEYYNQGFMHIGASTSVSGLTGFSAASTWCKLSKRYRRYRILGLSRPEAVHKLLDVESYFLLFTLLQIVKSFGGDLLSVTRRKQGLSKLSAYSTDSIGHSGHVGGFLGGVVCYHLFFSF